MKDLSFFLLKNSVGAKMKKGIRNFCNGDGSTSTLNQNQHHAVAGKVTPLSAVESSTTAKSPPTSTLEEMILRLELEEEVARKAKLKEYYKGGRRMSSVNNSDILRSARNALNQYPRFSLDGKDAMYRSSFRNSEIMGGRKSVCCDQGLRERYCKIGVGKSLCSPLPSTLGGEDVIWCSPGVVAKLMGLDSMPVPTNSKQKRLSSVIKRENLRRRSERVAMDMSNDDLRKMSSCSRTGQTYCVMKPVAVEAAANDNGGGWPTRRFL